MNRNILIALLVIGASVLSTIIYRIHNRTAHDRYIIQYLESDNCDIFSKAEGVLKTLPMGLCVPFNNNIIGRLNDLIFSDFTGNVLWRKAIWPDHHISFNDIKNTLLVISNKKIIKNKNFDMFNVIFEMSTSGDILFSWNMEEHYGDLIKKLGYDLSEEHYVPSQKKYSWRHDFLNYVLEIPNIPIFNKYPELKSGDLLVSSWQQKSLFSINKTTKKIVWVYSFKDSQSSGIHTPFFDKDLNLIFFINDIKNKKQSGIGKLNLESGVLKEISLPLVDGEQPFTKYKGAIYPDGSGYIVTISEQGIILYLDKNFEMTGYHRLKNKIPYRVFAVPHDTATKLMNQYSH